ncbi:serine/threonine-protein kinase BRI1-like 2 [Mangifera indica]|uniref:serine/threonine-protein kinase BRI1-like 2 n=1 Tax=Mangifera indica TaxID=29780 RepID=UPI001CF9DE4D|nr:serine/threonine-protein kinase BRI1-like 2 [Mangifera indica]
MITFQVLELVHSQLSGEIPSSLGQLWNLGVFDTLRPIPQRGSLAHFKQLNTPKEKRTLWGISLPECRNGNNQPAVNHCSRESSFPLLRYASDCVGNHNVYKSSGSKKGSRIRILNSLQTTHAATKWKIDKEKEPSSINVATFRRQLRKLKFSQLIEVTNGFSAASLIGSGGFGEVLKAIKKLIRLSYQEDQEFITEIETLGNIKFRNLVHLLGYCKVGEERLLVYEFLGVGGLEEVLHGISKEKDCKRSCLRTMFTSPELHPTHYMSKMQWLLYSHKLLSITTKVER